jgi:hypothetical protein
MSTEAMQPWEGDVLRKELLLLHIRCICSNNWTKFLFIYLKSGALLKGNKKQTQSLPSVGLKDERAGANFHLGRRKPPEQKISLKHQVELNSWRISSCLRSPQRP